MRDFFNKLIDQFKSLQGLKTEANVGILILTAAVFLAYASVRVTRFDPDLSGSYELQIPFENVTGLATSTAVRIAGIQVGEVIAIELVDGRALVTVAVYDKYRLHADSRATIKSIGILGDKYIEVTLGSANQQYLTHRDQIALVDPASDLDSLISDLSLILTDVKAVTSTLNESLGGQEGTEKVTRIVGNLDELTGNLNSAIKVTNQKIGPIMANLEQFTGDLSGITGENRMELKAMVANLRDFSEEISDFMIENKDQLNRTLSNLDSFMAAMAAEGPGITKDLKGILQENRENIKVTMEEVRGASANLNQAMENLDSIAYKIDSGQGTIGGLVNDEETIDSINEALDGVNEVLSPVNKMKIGLGFSSEKLTARNKYKSYVSLDLKPVRDHYYTLQMVHAPDGDETVTETIVTDNSSDSVTQNTTTYETVDSYKFSLMVTQRFFDTELKFGLMENSAGFAINQYFGKRDQFALNLQAHDFSRTAEPYNLRTGGYWRFMQNFYMVAGIDDMINTTTDSNGLAKKNPFFGLGVSFTEDNMKSILGTATGAIGGK